MSACLQRCIHTLPDHLLHEDEDDQHERRHDDEGHPSHGGQGEGVEAVKQQTSHKDTRSLHRGREGEHGT